MYVTSQKVRAESKKIPLDPPLQKGEAVELPGLIENLQGNTINAACIGQNALGLAPIGRGDQTNL